MHRWTVTSPDSQILVPAADVARLVNAIASEDRIALAAAVLQTVQTSMSVHHCALFAHEDDRNPRLLSAAGCAAPWTAIRLGTLYSRHYFKQDELQDVVQASPATTPNGSVIVCRTRTADIAQPEYRQACFEDLGICDRLTILVRAAKASWLSIGLYRDLEAGLFSETNIQALLGLAPLLSSCAARHYAADVDGESHFRGVVTDEVAELCPNLTVREREVLLRILDGVTINRIAEDLKLRPTTVATYRMRAYEKLGVGSRRELFATVLRQRASSRVFMHA